ncbi:MAG: glycosyltransferase family 2 protein [Solobacterium sp.]|nr:glycosyltransferase family 2 protein [Solobacterium sp.]
MTMYSVVVPVYNSEHTLETLYERLEKVFDEEMKEPFELLLVDDGSHDHSWDVMTKLRSRDERVKIFQMTRNFGQPAAVLCGFHYVSGDIIITMDDDLQHRPEEIPKMAKVLEERDDVDVVLARYQNRKHNFIRGLGTWVQMKATTMMLDKDPDLELTSFRMIRRVIVDAIKDTTVHRPQIGNLLVAFSSRMVNVDVQHDARAYGHSGYSFRKLAKTLMYDITTHTAFPLIVIRDIGIVTFLISLIMGIVILVRFFLGHITVEGWTSMILVMLAMGGLTLLSIGMLGEYLMHVLDETKKNPHYVVRRKEM